MKKNVIKKPPEMGSGDFPPDKEIREDGPQPVDVGGIFKKVLIPSDEKPEE